EQLQKAGYDEIRRIIREEEAPKPSTRLGELSRSRLPDGTAAAQSPARQAGPTSSKQLLGDLDWIAMKCLEKDRNRRYETANGLAQDIQRYLADEPVLAGPPSVSYRLRKFVRRNRGPVIAVSVLIVSLVAGVIGTSVGMIWAVRERDDK